MNCSRLSQEVTCDPTNDFISFGVPMQLGSASQRGRKVLCSQGFKGCSVPALAQTYTCMMQPWLRSLNCCFHVAVVDGPAGTATKALHPAWCTRLFGGPILHPLQHRLLSLDSHTGAGSSYRLPRLSAAAPRVSATWDLSRQMQCLSSSVALSRL